jgi:hypothetical protein
MIAALTRQAIKPKGIETMIYFLFYTLLVAGLALGVYGVVDALSELRKGR